MMRAARNLLPIALAATSATPALAQESLGVAQYNSIRSICLEAAIGKLDLSNAAAVEAAGWQIGSASKAFAYSDGLTNRQPRVVERTVGSSTMRVTYYGPNACFIETSGGDFVNGLKAVAAQLQKIKYDGVELNSTLRSQGYKLGYRKGVGASNSIVVYLGYPSEPASRSIIRVALY